MNPEDPLPVPLEDGCGASDPGDWAVPLPAASPGTPLMLITTPDVGAVRVAWFTASWAACTCACAAAIWAWAEASALGLTWVCTARLSREEVICCDAELIRDWPLIASECCLLLSLASCVCSWAHCAPLGQSALTLAWSLLTVAASA